MNFNIDEDNVMIFVVEKNFPRNSYMFKIDIKSTRARCEICSKLTIKTPGLFFYG